MGMDVYGKAPKSETGKYFRNNAWWWRPLADYCCSVAPGITAKCQYWHSNDGDGLNARDANKLADVLQAHIDSGQTASYAMEYTARQEQMPDEPCLICGGTGLRADVPNIGPGTNPCNGCDSTGKRRPSDTWYPFSVENVSEFVVFLRTCGGFEIH